MNGLPAAQHCAAYPESACIHRTLYAVKLRRSLFKGGVIPETAGGEDFSCPVKAVGEGVRRMGIRAHSDNLAA